MGGSVRENLPPEELPKDIPPPPLPDEPGRPARRSLRDFFMAESSDAPIESFDHHPLNIIQARPASRLTRGIDAMAGGLRLALVDVVLGGLELMIWAAKRILARAVPAK